MATRTARYRSHSPTPSPTHAYDHPQPFTPASTVGSMTLDTRSSQDNIYNGRNDLTLPPFSRNLVVGNGAPNSPRHTNYQQSYPISNPRDGKNYTRNNHPTPIPKNNVAREKHHYSYDDSNYSEFPQSKPPMDIQDPDLAAHRQLPSLGNPQYVNGSRSLPPINQAAYQPNYSTNLDTHRQRTLSINSIISSPGVSTPSTAYSSFGTPAHGNGTMKKRKKSFGTENGGEEDNIDSDDRERDGAKVTNGDGGGGGLNNTTSAAGLGLCLEDPDVRLAAEALGDLRAGKSENTPVHDHVPIARFVLHPDSAMAPFFYFSQKFLPSFFQPSQNHMYGKQFCIFSSSLWDFAWWGLQPPALPRLFRSHGSSGILIPVVTCIISGI